MRKINKSPNIPETLKKAPVPVNAKNVDKKYYKADDVRVQLIEDQYRKCAYCECSITEAYNDVEHYRPKSHYYWLGHNWDNLLYACEICNRTYKKDLFPLGNEKYRANSPDDGLVKEEPLLINPASETPKSHIRFREHMAVGISIKGKTTIEILHLNDDAKRPELINDRKILFEKYKSEKKKLKIAEEMLKKEPNLTAEIKELIALCNESIEKYISLEQPYSGMLISQI